MVLVHLQPVVIVIAVCQAIATDGGVGGVLDAFPHWCTSFAGGNCEMVEA